MTAVNHSIMGSIIMVSVANPVIGLPLAFASHFILDALPHFGAHTVAKPGNKEFNSILQTDAFLTACFLIIGTFAGYRAGLPLWLVPVGGTLGWIPDVMWYKHYQNDINGEDKHWDIVRKAHKKIQRYELSWGWIVESVWFIASVALLSRLIFM